MKQKKRTDRYGNIYYDVTFEAREAEHFGYEEPATPHTAVVVCDGYFYKVEGIDGKAATSPWCNTPKTAVRHGYNTHLLQKRRRFTTYAEWKKSQEDRI